jgi:hypothetical protein
MGMLSKMQAERLALERQLLPTHSASPVQRECIYPHRQGRQVGSEMPGREQQTIHLDSKNCGGLLDERVSLSGAFVISGVNGSM